MPESVIASESQEDTSLVRVIKQLRKFGPIQPVQESKIKALNPEQLVNLREDLQKFKSLKDLDDWLTVN
ncbi:DUF4351 domain-containing protein [Nostoc sp.]|uniref:DUF4351 domain-containing protein n=1 Tax=Nostoc sp. TaxID=1180 RepID=UPI002FF89797